MMSAPFLIIESVVMQNLWELINSVIHLLDSDKRFWESIFISISYALIVLVQQWHIIYSLQVEQFTLLSAILCHVQRAHKRF